MSQQYLQTGIGRPGWWSSWINAVMALLVLSATPGSVVAQDSDKKADKMMEKRLKMVKTQIRDRGVRDRQVLSAMEAVPRHEFVPGSLINQAYEDHPLFIGFGQTISQPYIVALMTEVLELEHKDRVLEIGTGSGYQAAVLGELVDSVFTIEIVDELGTEAAERLKRLGYENVFVRLGDGYKGWPEKAPFDAIIVTAAPPTIPQALVDQLAEGGRMIVPVGTGVQELILIEKKNGRVSQRDITSVRFVPMVHGKESGNGGD
jgi:protein-L-isoaspartate(D-aspartate) O-methyltransferase